MFAASIFMHQGFVTYLFLIDVKHWLCGLDGYNFCLTLTCSQTVPGSSPGTIKLFIVFVMFGLKFYFTD